MTSRGPCPRGEGACECLHPPGFPAGFHLLGGGGVEGLGGGGVA